jgi:hypothetical protein
MRYPSAKSAQSVDFGTKGFDLAVRYRCGVYPSMFAELCLSVDSLSSLQRMLNQLDHLEFDTAAIFKLHGSTSNAIS